MVEDKRIAEAEKTFQDLGLDLKFLQVKMNPDVNQNITKTQAVLDDVNTAFENFLISGVKQVKVQIHFISKKTIHFFSHSRR